MKTKLFLISTLLLGLLFSTSAQTALPYYSGFDNSAQKSGWTEYKLGVDSDPYEWNFSAFAPYSAPECLEHNYPVGGSQPTDDWFISPEFDFSNGATIDSLRHAYNGFGTPMAGDTVALYLITGSADPATASSWTMIYSFTDSAWSADGVWRKIEDLDIPATSGSCYLAFRYSTTNNWLDVKFDNLRISDKGLGGEEMAVGQPGLELFPNPADKLLTLSWPVDFRATQIEILNLQGQLIWQKEATAQIQVAGLPAGAYLLQVLDSTGKKLSLSFIKK